MSQINLDLLEISDEQALSALELIANHLASVGVQNLSFQCCIFEQEPSSPAPLAEVRNNMSGVLAEHGYLFSRMTSNFQIPNNNGNGNINFARRADGTANVSMGLHGPLDENAERRIGIGIVFHNAFGQFHRRKIFAQLPPEIADFYTRRESTLLRLEEIATRVTENTEAHRQRLDEESSARTRELENELRAESEKRSQALDKRENDLALREVDLEKADNTHARRKLRQDLKTALKARHDKFTLTRETENKRRPISLAFLVLMIVTLVASVYFGWLASNPIPQGMPAWFPLLRLGLSLAGFAGATIYYIRWQDRWSQVHADEEFRLKRLDLDVDRAKLAG
jgi:hypothetical protein